ncbi:MAG: 4-hydroxy-tetrahydrodipicolinate reductase [Bacteroidales bacterium]|jgi:4-hydroxy-tetrahydrodipicolinate reductase|nr:4-hydroxy-tetrahydrodipicolinate reductase [Bacteroidales bacterium]
MNIALIGYGKMGKEIEKIALERGHTIALVIDIANAADLTAENLRTKKVDVAIEFTTPATAFGNYVVCFDANVPVVSGTTGWLEKFAEVKHWCDTQNKGFFYASNFSLGVNIFFAVNKRLAELMNAYPDYDVAIEEIHHTQKLDAPSGTAITLAQDIVAAIDRKKSWQLNDFTSTEELQITAKRLGKVPGTHTITYDSEVDSIEISHCAKSRKGFALGVVIAAEFMNKKTGLYGMNDLLGL